MVRKVVGCVNLICFALKKVVYWTLGVGSQQDERFLSQTTFSPEPSFQKQLLQMLSSIARCDIRDLDDILLLTML